MDQMRREEFTMLAKVAACDQKNLMGPKEESMGGCDQCSQVMKEHRGVV